MRRWIWRGAISLLACAAIGCSQQKSADTRICDLEAKLESAITSRLATPGVVDEAKGFGKDIAALASQATNSTLQRDAQAIGDLVPEWHQAADLVGPPGYEIVTLGNDCGFNK